MSNFSKWLGAGIGFTFGGPIGAIMGFAAATVFDKFTKEGFVKEQREYQKNHQRQKAETLSGDFEISLLILASIVIKSDGRVDNRELNYVRNQFVGMYVLSMQNLNTNMKFYSEERKMKRNIETNNTSKCLLYYHFFCRHI